MSQGNQNHRSPEHWRGQCSWIGYERQTRYWTLDQLEEAAGVSRLMIVNVEQVEANSSVGTLLKISDALDIELPELVAPPETRSVRALVLETLPFCGVVNSAVAEYC